uniref:BFN domain-containing protein n=1 Tax=Salix viminalis TaxID=40686 RepID=A0A6N2N6H8_SALVM
MVFFVDFIVPRFSLKFHVMVTLCCRSSLFAIEKLIEGMQGDDNAVCADQFQLVGNVAEELGYDVKMVRITERVANTYFARLCFSKPGESDILSVDARPSDAINVANRCKAPIYISKQIVLTDAIRIGYGVGRARNSKPIYDVFLDSAADGPDSLGEELDLVRNMNLAIKEERYTDAAMWRDKLTELRKSRQEH